MTDPIEPVEEKKECALCGKALAGLGIALGLFFLYIGVDVVTGGKLTQVLGLGGKAPVEAEE